MLKGKKIRKSLAILITMMMVLGSFGSFAFAEEIRYNSAKEQLQEAASIKISSEVIKDLEKEEYAEVLVYMKDQVDTEMVAQATRSAVATLMTPYNVKLEVRKGVVEALRDKAEITQANVINYLEQEKANGNVEEFTSYHIVNMLYVKATKEVIENISYMTEIEKISKNKTYTMDTPETSGAQPEAVEGLEWNIERVKADQVWDLGFDGTGVVVATLDSGSTWNHPALMHQWRGYDSSTGTTNPEGNWYDPSHGTTLPTDDPAVPHGTHVMGTILGQEPDGSNKIGVAPGAKWIAVRVFNTSGSTTDAILLDGAEWILAPGGDPTMAPDVVNNSWGGGPGIDDWYRDAVRNWRAAGIFPAFSAGNQRQGEPAPWPGSISNPANYPESYAVAALDINNTRASFSKLGPSPYDEDLIKPNIAAPGVGIRSSIPGGYEGGWSGTSMSCPAVAGVVALMLSANSSLTVDEIEAVLAETAVPLTDSTYPEAPNFGYGYGLVDAFEAVSSIASGTGFIGGKVLTPGEDTSLPVILHQQEITEAYMGSNIDITAEIMDDVSVVEAELLVKEEGKSYWMLAPMKRISGDHKDGIYKGTISNDMLLGDSIVYKIRARDYGGEVVVTEDYSISIAFGVLPGEYVQGFESHANGWSLDEAWQWGAPSGADPEAFEGEQLAGTTLGGSYPNSADSWMITPPIDLRDSTLAAASLGFNHWYDLETNFDYGYVYVTNDFGENWHQAGPTYNGTSGQWREAFVSLNDFIGSQNPVYVAYRFTSDGSVAKQGWYIDNVRIMGPDEVPPSAPTNLSAAGTATGVRLTWTHSPDGDLSHYNIYRSVVSGSDYTKITETNSSSYLDTDVEEGTVYYYVLDAQDTSGNISDYTEEVSGSIAVVDILFTTDFEEDDGGFVTDGTNNSWAWGAPISGPNGAASGVNLWATNLEDNYPLSSDSWIETPAITIPEDKLGVLTFNHWYDFEGTTTLWDYGQVEISTDDGATWTNITPGGRFGTRLQTWRNEEIALEGYTGETVKIRFFFHSDGSVAYLGWYIDDVTVIGLDYVPPPIVDEEEITYDDGSAEDALVLNQAGNGLAVRFTPNRLGMLEGANIYLWGNDFPEPGGNRLGFVVYTEDNGTLAQVGDPIYVDNLTRGDWNYIDLSSLNFSTDGDFYISTMQDDIGVNVPATGMDDNPSSPYSRSFLNIEGEMVPIAETGFYYSTMIRAIVNYNLDGIEADYNVKPVENNKLQNNLGLVNNISPVKAANEVEDEKSDYKSKEPSFSLKRNVTNKYEVVEDTVISNTPITLSGGIPVADAVVTVLETGRSVKTDVETGKFLMRHPITEEGETFTLRAEAYGHYPQEVEITLGEDETISQIFVLDPKPQGSIEGRIFDRYYGNPAANAVIRVVEDPKIAPVVADENGNFTFPAVYEGTYTLKVIADGFEPGEVVVEVDGDEITNVEIPLKRFVGYEDEIVYDDGTGENALVLNASGNGLAVRFTPNQFGKVKGANVYIWDTSWPTPGGNRIGFAIYSTDENGTPSQVGDPIFVNVERGAFNYIDLSSHGFSTDRDFYISTIQDAAGTSCPGTGIDESSPHADRSYLNIAGDFIPMSDEDVVGALMIRAIMEYSVSVPVITNLEALTYTNQDSITVEGTVTADGQVNVYVNGEEATSVTTENRSFTAVVDLPADENTIIVTAEMDGVETEPSQPITIIKDKEAPVLVVEEPLDNAKINVEAIHVIGNVSDNIHLDGVLINGVEVVVGEDGSFDERIFVNQGENLVTIEASDYAGNTTVIERRVFVELNAPVITNLQPQEDIELRAGETLEISFDAPTGGAGYYRILLPFEPASDNLGVPMIEVDGVYSATWTVPGGLVASNLQVEVVYVDEHGYQVSKIATGRVTVIGNMEDLIANSVIIGNEAFDIEYLNNNADAQMKLIDAYNADEAVYIKLNATTIVTTDGSLAGIENLPERLTYYAADGKTAIYEKY
ncbi:S8 family serine peptidase [Alkaliphilus serpentinus]|uniref:S8 family serine peptidase n=1 Tax=Alkaliphilus serpentinus TaxID=1482731 RepID=A0A833HNV5_9FIRM|nr:S8 family serine peptidase [Alkaliphilus serpentinus]KAB3530008.1 S8 family serine peptidase [Alkaliphilus serpentinus]